MGLFDFARRMTKVGTTSAGQQERDRSWFALPGAVDGYDRGCEDARSGEPPARRRDPEYMAGYADALLERARTVLNGTAKA